MQIRDVKALREAVRQGEQPRFLFFWGHQPPRDAPGAVAGPEPAGLRPDGRTRRFANSLTPNEIIASYPSLKREDIQAAVAYAGIARERVRAIPA